MLKALELVGFKSFADRTRFEFPPGITVVVGPNGSGKSNIVDAIKWVLGEQSVKSLRGREMADVIFNGSGSRRATNAAEITLTLDNSKHLLSIDAAEVHITRRVYRSGEGEYLLNRNPARLRDIRDLLAGTGLGSQAYSVIEQGKVDVLLQSSPRDRRVIFEEAAGISRFKLRKVEALRRLERVEQNLLRLSDIVDEVESRLRGVRNQAGKARRYKEHTDRLQELRTQVGLVDWKRLSDRLAEFQSELQSLGDARNAALAESERLEAQLMASDAQSDELTRKIREAEAQIAANRERIAAAESTIEHQRSRGLDLEQEIARYRRQLAAMSTRAGDVQQQLQDTDRFAASRRRTPPRHRQAIGRGRTRPDRSHGRAGSSSRRERAMPDGLRAANAAGRGLGQPTERLGEPGGRSRWTPDSARQIELPNWIARSTGCSGNWKACGAAGHNRPSRHRSSRSGWPPPRTNSTAPTAARRGPRRAVGIAPPPQRGCRACRGAGRTGAPPRGAQCRREGSAGTGGQPGRARLPRRFAGWWPTCSMPASRPPRWSTSPWGTRPSTWWPAPAPSC